MTELAIHPTAEEIERHYSACMDSVNLINAGKPERMSDADWADTVARNQEHLKIMLAKEFWTTEDLSPLQTSLGKDTVEASLQSQIDLQKNPVQASGLPWATA